MSSVVIVAFSLSKHPLLSGLSSENPPSGFARWGEGWRTRTTRKVFTIVLPTKIAGRVEKMVTAHARDDCSMEGAVPLSTTELLRWQFFRRPSRI